MTNINYGAYDVDEGQDNGASDTSKGSPLAPLTDSTRLHAFKEALSNWNLSGYIEFELTQTAYEWIKREFDALTLKEIGRLMCEYVEAEGEIDEVPETRPEWSSDYEFHFDLRFTIQDKPVYVETRLRYKLPLKPDCSTILVVNIHAP